MSCMFSVVFRFFLLFFLFFATGFYLYYRYYYPPFPDISRLKKYYSDDILLKTGAKLHTPKRKDHFLNFSVKKPNNTIRIGVFGDSYVYGDEVDETASIPSHLQNMLNKHFPNIEVLNFGVTGSGFQEQFFLWEKYAKLYGLDYILIGPRWFHPDRSLSFRKNCCFERKTPLHYPHERFILHKNKLKSVHVKGVTLKERYKNYYRLIPSLRVLRYDIKPFFILDELLPFVKIPEKNPFYYYKPQSDINSLKGGKVSPPLFKTSRKNKLKSPRFPGIDRKNKKLKTPQPTDIYLSNSPLDPSAEEEASKINILLLEKIKNFHHGKTLTLVENNALNFHSDASRYHSVKDKYNITFIDYPFEKLSLYRTSLHYSSLGYELSAAFFFNGLIGKKTFDWKMITCRFSGNNFKRPPGMSKIKLSEVDSVSLENSDKILFHYISDSIINDYKIGSDVKSFIGFFSRSLEDFGNTVYRPVTLQLTAGMKIYMQINKKDKISLGRIQTVDPYQKIFEFHANYITQSIYPDYKMRFLFNRMPEILQNKIDRASDIKLFAEDYPVGSMHWNKAGDLTWSPGLSEKNFLAVYGPTYLIREADLPDKFSLDIRYTLKTGKSFKARTAYTCSKKTKRFYLHLFDFSPLKG